MLPFRLAGGRATFQEYGPEQGLNNVGLHTMIQDRAGYLWVGSDNGLFRYNGKRFQRYGEQHGLPSSVILSLGESADGMLWVATAAGLARLVGDRFQPDGPRVNIELPAETNLAFDSKDRLYVGTSHGLLIGPPGVRGASRTFELQPGTGSVSAVHVDTDGVVWFGCDPKLCRLDGGRVEAIGPDHGLPADVWQSILTDRDGNLWVRSAGRLLMRKRGAANFTNEKNLPATNAAATLFLDRQGHVLAPSDVGLARWHAGNWELVDARRGLASNAVTCAYQDRDGALWLGLRGVGAARWLGYNLAESWTMADGLASPIVWAIQEDGKGVWVGTDQGLNFLSNRGSQWRTWTSRQGLPGDHIVTLAIDPDGSIWIGAFPGGVARLEPESGQIRKYGIESGLASNSIFGLTFDREGRLWVSTAVGLFRSTGSGSRVRFEKQLPSADASKEIFRQVTEDSHGRIWAAGSQGLRLFEKGKWRRLGRSEGLPGDHPTHLAETADGAIWVAYNDALGLSRLTWSNAVWKVQHLTQQDEGLPSDNVVFLGSDVRGCLWAGTDKGIVAFDGKAWHRYGHEDGLISDFPNPNAFEAAANGNIWIGTARGLTRLRPSDLALAGQPPPVTITSLVLGTKTPGLSVPLVVPHFDRSLAVEFNTLSFADENDIRFRYRLAGLESQWTTTHNERASYPDLPPGRYTFEVMAGNAQGVWSVEPARVSFQILPAWWMTWWCRILAAGGGLAAVVLFWRRRVSRLMEHQEELAEIVREKTRCESILQAVSFAAHGFIYGTDWRNQVQAILERLGKAASADSVQLFEHHRDSGGEACASLRFEWSPMGLSGPDFRQLQSLRFDEGYARWRKLLLDSEAVYGKIDGFSQSEQALMHSQDLMLLAAVPVLAGSTVWGHMSFYQHGQAEWSAAELAAVKAAAGLLGAAIRRREIEQSLYQAHEDLECRVYERTRTLVQEVEERRSVEEVLRQAEQRFRAVFDGAPIGLKLMDLDGCIVETNRAFQQMLGYSSEQLRGRPFSELAHPDDFEIAVLCFGELVLRKRDRYQMEKRYYRNDGTTMWARLTVSLLDWSGGDSFAIGMVEDVTEHKQLEEQFRQSQKMEAIGRLAGGVAHDFNNLLTVIKGYSELLLKRMDADHPMRKNLGQIRKAAERAASLVSQLLSFSRKQLIEPRVLDLNNLVRDVEKMLRRLIGEDIQMVTILQPVSHVKADPGQLEQVLMNLTVNAKDAMPAGGRIIIETSSVEIMDSSREGLAPGSYTVVSIADTGVGMTDLIRSRIFEPFFTTKEVGQGTGLGLSTVYGIVKQSGGAIFVESEPGRGTLFEIFLPSIDAAIQVDTPPLPDSHTQSSETILVVEDERLVRGLIIETLQERGFRVLAARDGAEACRIAAKCDDSLKLLVTDVVLPRMNGLEVAERLLESRPGLRVLYLSGYTDQKFEATIFLRKPFGPEELVRKVRAVLDQADSADSVPQTEATTPSQSAV